MVGGRGNVEDHGGIYPLGVQIDYRVYRKTCVGQEVGIYPVGDGTRSSVLTPHTQVNSNMAVNNSNTGGMPPH